MVCALAPRTTYWFQVFCFPVKGISSAHAQVFRNLVLITIEKKNAISEENSKLDPRVHTVFPLRRVEKATMSRSVSVIMNSHVAATSEGPHTRI